jgi:hypothetical protein
MSATSGFSGALSIVATMRYDPSGSGATTTSPAGAKNSDTSVGPTGQSRRTSASTNEAS